MQCRNLRDKTLLLRIVLFVKKRTAGSDTQGEDAWWTSKRLRAGSINKRAGRDYVLLGLFDRNDCCWG